MKTSNKNSSASVTKASSRISTARLKADGTPALKPGPRPGTTAAGDNSPVKKVTSRDVRIIRALFFKHELFQKDIAKLFGITQPQVSAICTRKSWPNVD